MHALSLVRRHARAIERRLTLPIEKRILSPPIFSERKQSPALPAVALMAGDRQAEHFDSELTEVARRALELNYPAGAPSLVVRSLA